MSASAVATSDSANMTAANQSQPEPDNLDPNWWIYVAIACGVCCLCCVVLIVVLLIRKRRRRDESKGKGSENETPAKGMSGIAAANADAEMVSFEMRSTRASEYARMPDIVGGGNSVFYAASSFVDAPGGSSVASARGGEVTYASPGLLSGGSSTTPMRTPTPVVYASGFGGGAQPDYGGAEFIGDVTHPAPAGNVGHQGAGLLFDNYGTGK